MGSRLTFTHNPHILYNLHTGEGAIGRSRVIFKTFSKENPTVASDDFKKKLSKRGLKAGINPDVGENGLVIEVSSNGWEQRHDIPGHVRAICRFPKQIMLLDNWTYFHSYDLFIKPLLDNLVFPRMCSL